MTWFLRHLEFFFHTIVTVVPLSGFFAHVVMTSLPLNTTWFLWRAFRPSGETRGYLWRHFREKHVFLWWPNCFCLRFTFNVTFMKREERFVLLRGDSQLRWTWTWNLQAGSEVISAVTIAATPVPGNKINWRANTIFQRWGSGSACFWASRIRNRIH